uniref:SCP domain-containing protein n=1 Tax=Callorhinchus milii TaxID=7868 RepID=A0A4W3HHZ8_CALMI
ILENNILPDSRITQMKHFTQLVWQETKEMGIAYSVSNKGAFVVAQYSPHGNVTKPNSFEANVLPKLPGSRHCPKKKDPKLKKAERSPCN